MPTVCVIADTDRKHRNLTIPPCDFLIHCGDMCYLPLQNGEFRFDHAEFLQDRVITVAGPSIYGSAWCPDLTSFVFCTPAEILIERWRMIPSGIDILVAHTPPARILDFPTPGYPHLGSLHLRADPTPLALFGHAHSSHGTHFQDAPAS